MDLAERSEEFAMTSLNSAMTSPDSAMTSPDSAMTSLDSAMTFHKDEFIDEHLDKTITEKI